MKLLPCSFSRYHLSETENNQGGSFNDYQLAYLQNLIADCAEEKLNLKYDPEKPHTFQQREAELTGQIGILRYLIQTSEEYTRAVTTQSPEN